MRRATLFLLALVTLSLGHVVTLPSCQAQPAEAGPSLSEYAITPEAGAWLIIVAHYSGPHGQQLALEMAQEIRERYNIPAYVFSHGAEERRKQQEEIDRFKQLTPDTPRPRIRMVRIEEEWAVLVGGYKDMDAARRALDKVKKLQPPKEKGHLMDVVTQESNSGMPPPGQGSFPNVAGGEEKKLVYLNPFATSFVVHNPTIPLEHPKQDPAKADQLLQDLNSGRPYNLLKCRQPWTLVIKEFPGASSLQPRTTSSVFLEMLGFRQSADLLTASALQAEEVAKVLRGNNFDAYVLHTRYSSVVTVGGFDKPDDPRLQQLQRQLANLKIGPIECFARPMPMQVPHP
jgi:hypothetical protein